MEHRHARRAARAARRAVELPGLDDDGVQPLQHTTLAGRYRHRHLTERDVLPALQLGVREPDLLVRGVGDLHAQLGDVAGLVWRDLEAQARCVDEDEAVTTERDVDGQGAHPLDLERRIERRRERWDVAGRHRRDLAVCATSRDLDEAGRGLEMDDRLGFRHRQDAGLQQDGRHTHAVAARHRRRVLWLHHDPAHVRSRIRGRHQQIHVPEHTTARLVEHEVP